MRCTTFALLTLALLAPACMDNRRADLVEVARPSIILPQISDNCGSAGLQDRIGSDYTVLASETILGDLRILQPGDKVDGQISPSRLNAELDSQGRIRRLFCG